ncbi:DNA polymerase kappa isoform X1 [Anolis sagrei]|uniref:DNA polymerase kappa isoform X1 n=3 Tax=Anolis sagrei TaxID=38937 RepID=UPI003520CBA2
MENTDDVFSQDGLLLRMGLNDNKAGMQGLDKEKINKIILEASKGSKFYENELKKDQQVNKRIEKMLEVKKKITDQQIMKAQLQMDKIAMELERNRDLSCTIVHIDMDAFYAAVEMRDDPELRDKPIAVGSMSMLSTSNYHARRYGVRAAMPGFIAKKLCPHLSIVPLNFTKYREVSEEVREILAEYDPNFMPMGLDEAYLNITEHLEERKNWDEGKRKLFIRTNNSSLHGEQNRITNESKWNENAHYCSPVLFDDDISNCKPKDPSLVHSEEQEHRQSTVLTKSVVFGTLAEEAVEEIRFRIEQKTRLTASAGIAPNTMLAKMCSDQNKPNGQFRIPPDREHVMNFIKDLPIRKVPGIGKVTEKMLKALGIVTCTDLYQQRALISLLFSETSWHHFLEISLGLGSTQLERDGERKSMSTERTFNELNTEEQYSLCKELCADLAQDLKKEGLKARTVTLKLKNVNFEVKTRATTVLSAVCTEEEIFAVAKDLLGSEMENVAPQPLRLRLMGVRVSGFLNEEEKKYQQKSIVNFLEPGKPTSTSKLFSRKSAEETFPKAPDRESFFNKKRSTRLEAEQAVSLNEPLDQQNLQDMAPVTSSVDQTEYNELKFFVCPVCFEEHQDSTLEAFNRHIDKCLSGTVEKDCTKNMNNKSWDNTSDLPLDRKKKDCEKDNTSNQLSEVQSNVGDCAANGNMDIFPMVHNNGHDNESGCAVSSDCVFGMHAKQDFTSEVSSVEYFEEPYCTDNKLPCFSDMSENNILVCPVCNLEQKTKDLAVFNRHVDVCLNKGIIKQLTEKPKNTGTLDREHNTASTIGAKRSGKALHQSTSKKAKSANSKCTIETFFK